MSTQAIVMKHDCLNYSCNIISVVSLTALIESDEHQLYANVVERFFPEAEFRQYKGARSSIAGQGELKKNYFDPLFKINHTCAMLRANINRLFRRTWCTTKRPDMLKNHLDIYIYFIIKPWYKKMI